MEQAVREGKKTILSDHGEKPQRHPPLWDIPMAEASGNVQAEETEVAASTLANEAEETVTEVEEAGNQEERVAVGGKGVDSDDDSDSGLDFECDADD